MNLQQDKLTKSEWEGIEAPTSDSEKKIYNLIIDGFNNINLKKNDTLSLVSYLKIKVSPLINDYIFMNYLQPKLIRIFNLYNAKYDPITLDLKKLGSADLIRINHMNKNIEERKNMIFEFVLINYIENILRLFKKKDNEWIYYYYTLSVLKTYDIKNINSYLIEIIETLLDYYENKIDLTYLIKNAKPIINSNKDLQKYVDLKLYDHQKELFVRMNETIPKLIFYVAPTGTGKTLSPLGLSHKYKIIFVCAVRHVGLALAKAAISMNKCTAFAFGCTNIDDIRLHYYSAKDYIVNNKTGGIFKVDNSVGDKVEIMISDIKSYLYAMNYMLAFNNKSNIILYWDEPTITLDYENHEYHSIIKRNWNENKIPNIVLSSATLPTQDDLVENIKSYKSRFNGNFYFIKNVDYSKTISLINRDGYIVTLHHLTNDYKQIQEMVKYIESNKTILRYVDLEECLKFIDFINKKKFYKNTNLSINYYFNKINEITIHSIKIYYLKLLKNIKISDKNEWEYIFNYFNKNREKKFESTTFISSHDAHTLTNGPTIYITQEVNKIAYFCIQSMQIPSDVLKEITKAINYNSDLIEKIVILEKDYEDGLNKDDVKENKLAKDRGISPEMRTLKRRIDNLKNLIKTVNLPDIYIPNTNDHLFKWAKNESGNNKAFTSDISDYVVEKIMLIENMDDIWKLLLLMGIGVFSTHSSSQYIEIMKDLAKSKKLYLIIASSDFIYGTNYQFDHCYIGKDLLNMTQEKLIQAFGRVGRNKISDEYSIRLRDDSLISKIFTRQKDKIEVKNMQELFR